MAVSGVLSEKDKFLIDYLLDTELSEEEVKRAGVREMVGKMHKTIRTFQENQHIFLCDTSFKETIVVDVQTSSKSSLIETHEKKVISKKRNTKLDKLVKRIEDLSRMRNDDKTRILGLVLWTELIRLSGYLLLQQKYEKWISVLWEYSFGSSKFSKHFAHMDDDQDFQTQNLDDTDVPHQKPSSTSSASSVGDKDEDMNKQGTSYVVQGRAIECLGQLIQRLCELSSVRSVILRTSVSTYARQMMKILEAKTKRNEIVLEAALRATMMTIRVAPSLWRTSCLRLAEAVVPFLAFPSPSRLPFLASRLLATIPLCYKAAKAATANSSQNNSASHKSSYNSHSQVASSSSVNNVWAFLVVRLVSSLHDLLDVLYAGLDSQDDAGYDKAQLEALFASLAPQVIHFSNNHLVDPKLSFLPLLFPSLSLSSSSSSSSGAALEDQKEKIMDGALFDTMFQLVDALVRCFNETYEAPCVVPVQIIMQLVCRFVSLDLDGLIALHLSQTTLASSSSSSSSSQSSLASQMRAKASAVSGAQMRVLLAYGDRLHLFGYFLLSHLLDLVGSQLLTYARLIGQLVLKGVSHLQRTQQQSRTADVAQGQTLHRMGEETVEWLYKSVAKVLSHLGMNVLGSLAVPFVRHVNDLLQTHFAHEIGVAVRNTLDDNSRKRSVVFTRTLRTKRRKLTLNTATDVFTSSGEGPRSSLLEEYQTINPDHSLRRVSAALEAVETALVHSGSVLPSASRSQLDRLVVMVLLSDMHHGRWMDVQLRVRFFSVLRVSLALQAASSPSIEPYAHQLLLLGERDPHPSVSSLCRLSLSLFHSRLRPYSSPIVSLSDPSDPLQGTSSSSTSSSSVPHQHQGPRPLRWNPSASASSSSDSPVSVSSGPEEVAPVPVVSQPKAVAKRGGATLVKETPLPTVTKPQTAPTPKTPTVSSASSVSKASSAPSAPSTGTKGKEVKKGTGLALPSSLSVADDDDDFPDIVDEMPDDADSDTDDEDDSDEDDSEDDE